MGGMKRGAVLALHRNNDDAGSAAFDGNLTQTPLTINSDATVTNEDASLVWLGGDGTDIVKTTATVDSSLKELVITMFDDGAGDEVFVATDNAALVFGPSLSSANDNCLFKMQAGASTKVGRTVMEHSGSGPALSIWHQEDNGGDGVFVFAPSTFVFGLSTDTTDTFIIHDWYAGDGSNAQSLRLKFSGTGRKAQFLNPLLFQFGPDAQGSDEDCAISLQGGDATNIVRSLFSLDTSGKTLAMSMAEDNAGDGAFVEVTPTFVIGDLATILNIDPVLQFSGGTGSIHRDAAISYNAGNDQFTIGSTKVNFSGSIEVNSVLEHTGSTLGFFSVTPAALQTAITQTFSTASTTSAALTAATLTDNSGGAATDNTIGAITNANNAGSADVVPTADAIAELAEEINALRVDVLNAKSVQTTIIDHLQTFGLEQ